MSKKEKLRAVVIYPFAGTTDISRPLFDEILEIAFKKCDSVIVVVEERGNTSQASLDIRDAETRGMRITKQYSRGVDTCQNWIDGWRVALKDIAPDGRIVLLPGDVSKISKASEVLSNLSLFIDASDRKLIIGDFTCSDAYSDKQLIDVYGIFPLVANWFPDAEKAIRHSDISKPRSEFLNVEAKFLEDLLKKKPFAYEQTLAMLIRLWDQIHVEAKKEKSNRGLEPHAIISSAITTWSLTVGKRDIGVIADASTDRQYPGAIDQIERTERMLRALWRELREWGYDKNPDDFMANMNLYEKKDERSNAIRNAARITIWPLISK